MKTRTVARCQSCGATVPRWVGRCPECAEWGTVVEEPEVRGNGGRSAASAPDLVPLAGHEPAASVRLPAGLSEVDRVLGGGFARGSVVLLAGEPGVGKSTLILQIAMAMADAGDVVLLVCGEEAPQQVRARAGRLGAIPPSLATLGDPSLDGVLAAIGSLPGAFVVIDSIQSVYDPEIPSAPGSVSQVRECGARIARAARDAGSTVVLVGHVTKEGAVAGPRVLEHLVDVVLAFDGDREGGMRILRTLKNRFGAQDMGFFEMTADGLVAIRDASGYLLADRCTGLSGSVLACAVEGRRPLVLEMQALVAESRLTMPRRVALGVEASRLPLLLAVVERRLHIPLFEQDVFVSAVGGIRATEPACDLPVILAILSSVKKVALPEDVAAFGEVGLAGEVRRVSAGDRRLAEARSVGVTRVIVPAGYTGDDAGLELYPIRHARDALTLLGTIGRRTAG